MHDNNKLMELITKALPGSNQISDWIIKNEHQVRFTWRGCKFVVHSNLLVEEIIQDGLLTYTNLCILLKRLLEIEYRDGKLASAVSKVDDTLKTVNSELQKLLGRDGNDH